MWATATLSCRLWPPATATGNHGPFTVSASAKYSRPRKNIKYDYNEDEDEERDNHPESEDNWKQQEIGDSVPNSPKISGSVVLLALQKASAKKTSKKKKSNTMKYKQADAIADYSDVKPLCIKSDWKDRLDDLETQLHQLIHNT